MRVFGNHRAEDLHTTGEPFRRDHVDRGCAEDVAGDLLQDQPDAERDQQGVQRAVVHPLDQRDLQQHTHGAADEEADDQ